MILMIHQQVLDLFHQSVQEHQIVIEIHHNDNFQSFLVSFKILIYVNIFPLIVPYLVKAIHVELANKGGKIVVLKIFP